VVAAALLVAQLVSAKATRDALFLSHFPVTALPAMSSAAAVLSLVVSLWLARAMVRLGPARVVPMAVGLGGGLLLLEWAIAPTWPRLAAAAVYLHVAVLGAPLLSGLWSLINERFDPYTAKRSIGTISTGASLGGLVGGLIAWSASSLISVRSTLLVLAALGTLSLPALLALRGRAAATAVREPRPAPLRAALRTPYVRNLALLVGLIALTEALLDYVMSASASASYGRGAPLLSFFAQFHLATGVLSLALQAVVTRAALLRLGLAGTLALPSGIVLSCGALALALPRLWSTTLLRAAQAASRNALFRPAYELLYVPLPEERKRSSKVIVDVACDRLGTILGAGVVAAVLAAHPPDARSVLLLLVLPLAGLGLALALRSRAGYVSMLAESLRSGVLTLDVTQVLDGTTRHEIARLESERIERAAGPTQTVAAPGPGAPDDPWLLAALELRSGDKERIRRVLASDAARDARLVSYVIPLLARDDLFLDVVKSLRAAAERCTGQLVDALLDPAQQPLVRRRIPRVLKAVPTQRAADGLLLGLREERSDLRYRCAQALLQIRQMDVRIAIPPEQILTAALREIASDTGTTRLEQVFLILALALEREPLETALRALRIDDPALRGTALEYLDNVLPEPVKKALWPRLSVAERPRSSGRSTEQIRDDLLRSTAVRVSRRSRAPGE
jgi:hypothetical protein